jgi:3-deoxy-D-manno-octulosonic acid kinase
MLLMKTVTHKQKSLAIVYDASLMDGPEVEWFNVDFWRSRQALTGEAVGRGSAWYINAPFGSVVLRQYLRGGWAAKLSHQNYFFTTVSRSRPFREYHLLAALYEQGLPVPRPVAALCEFRGLISSGALLTACIPCAQTLADVLPGQSDDPHAMSDIWARVGKCIRQFHDAGVWHADLNARNILLDAELRVFLIDLDRARFTPGKRVNGEGNLTRLKRSLVKLWPSEARSALQQAWTQLETGYYG